LFYLYYSSRRRHTRFSRDWSSDVCSSDLTMFDSRNNLSSQVVADVREFMGPKVYDTVIPRNVRISEAPSHGKPVLVYDLKCVGKIGRASCRERCYIFSVYLSINGIRL